jgi:hypothetical protein
MLLFYLTLPTNAKTPGAINAQRGLASGKEVATYLFYFARDIIMSRRKPLQCLSSAITTGADW